MISVITRLTTKDENGEIRKLIKAITTATATKTSRAALNFIALIPSCSIRQMLANFLELNSKGLYLSKKKKKNVVVLSSRAPQNVKLAIFSSQSCNDGKEMYKKALCSCKVVVLLI